MNLRGTEYVALHQTIATRGGPCGGNPAPISLFGWAGLSLAVTLYQEFLMPH